RWRPGNLRSRHGDADMPTWSPSPAASPRPRDCAGNPETPLERVLRWWFGCGLMGVCLVPALRGSSEWIGWWPLWLVGMPLAAWWALHRFRLPAGAPQLARRLRQLRPRVQARRRPGRHPLAVARRAAAYRRQVGPDHWQARARGRLC